jgi:hypothetical protein
MTDSAVTATLFSEVSNDPSAFCCFARYARPLLTRASIAGAGTGPAAGCVCAHAKVAPKTLTMRQATVHARPMRR